MVLTSLISGIKIIESINFRNIKIIGISNNSRTIEKGYLFIAVSGNEFDGHDYIVDAINNGANVILHEKPIKEELKSLDKIVFIKVTNSREALAIISANFYNNSHKNMSIIGVTGTNGKTTTSDFIYQILKKLGYKVGLISTIGAKYNNLKFSTGPHTTTPDPIFLHKIINKFYKKGCKYLAIEVTSHAIDQYRTHGINFDISVITNVTPEHLDYHKSFNNYLLTKSKIINQSNHTILNKYDPSIKKLLKLAPKALKYTINDYQKYKFPKTFIKKFPGEHDLQNASLAVDAVQRILNTDCADTLKSLKKVKGRFNITKTNQDFNVIIDFAHDHNSLEKTLKTTKKITKGKIISIFGCAGLRDKKKRPKMGFIAGNIADIVIITAEDPRTEDLSLINKSIEAGLIKSGKILNKDYFIINDRTQAINFALNKLAKREDSVLITGKGHEKTMCFNKAEISWSDHDAVKKLLIKKEK